MWIKCSERLPAPGERVLMCLDGRMVCEGFVSKSGNWVRGVYNVNTAFHRSTKVTHWMPLPEGPEEDV